MARERATRVATMILATLLLSACVGDGAPRTAADPDKPVDTCQHTAEGGQPRTVCY